MANTIADELETLLSELDNQDISQLSEEKVTELRKKLNPYGRTIEGSDKHMNFSITQISHEYWKKLIISGFVGYLNRMADEWKVPAGVPVTTVYDYLADPTLVDCPQAILDKQYQPTIDDYEDNKEAMKKRVIVKEFLEEMFQFNPEEHVRSAYRPCRGDNTREPIETVAGKLAVDHLNRTDKKFRSNEQLYDTKPNEYTIKKVTKTVKGKNGASDKVITRNVKCYADVKRYDTVEPIVNSDGVGVASDSVAGSGGVASDSSSVGSVSVDPTIRQTVREFLPPHDMFGRFKMYFENNYEEIREFVKDAYCEKPDFELAINAYSVHDTAEEAEKFKKKHRNEVIAEVFTVVCGKWCFFDSFKEQRENVNFYNDKTIVLEEMVAQLQKDEELGRDLMKKRVEKTKKKNMLEDGPDAETFKQYVAQNQTLQKMGADYIGDMADDDMPEDSVQVDVWRVAKGGVEIVKDKFYTATDASTVMPDAKDNEVRIKE